MVDQFHWDLLGFCRMSNNQTVREDNARLVAINDDGLQNAQKTGTLLKILAASLFFGSDDFLAVSGKMSLFTGNETVSQIHLSLPGYEHFTRFHFFQQVSPAHQNDVRENQPASFVNPDHIDHSIRCIADCFDHTVKFFRAIFPPRWNVLL